MGTRDSDTASNDDAAIEWARHRFAFNDVALVSDWPWARTYRLGEGPTLAYLKILQIRAAGVLDVTARLSQCFERQLPRVLGHDIGLGYLLTAAHQARELDYDSPHEDLLAVAKAYARLQVEAARMPELRAGLPCPEFTDLPHQLLAFLQPQPASTSDTEHVGADYFIGTEDAARYHRLLARRLGLLVDHLKPAQELPLTVNHGDLRPPNTAIADDGRCIILDWDDALAGPAGMSLHGLFSGCAVPTVLLSDSASAQAATTTPQGQILWAYIHVLADGGYADLATLQRVLPATTCGGVIWFMLNFRHYPGEASRQDVASTLRSRCSDLLNLCDLLCARDPTLALELAADYEAGGDLARAQALMQDQAARRPDDVPLRVRLAQLCCDRGEFERAEEVLRDALERAPQQASLHAALGAVLTRRLVLDDARQALRQALALDPALAEARADLERVQALESMRADAQLPERMPILRYEPRTAATVRVRPEQVALGVELFKRYGTLQIDNAFPVEAIERLQTLFFERYTPYFREDDHPDALRLGDKRYMLTVDMEEPFDAPGLIGAPTVLPIIREVLGDDCVLGAYTAVISLPGSKDQRLHKDHPALFPHTEWHFKLPCFAAQIIIPLVPLDEFSGTTRFYKGTHLFPTEQAEASGHQDPVVPLGSCLLTDYRCAHRGRGNRSERVRPILTLIYNRPWFHDFKNYGQQPPLRLPDEAYERMPSDLKPLVRWWKEEHMYRQTK